MSQGTVNSKFASMLTTHRTEMSNFTRSLSMISSVQQIQIATGDSSSDSSSGSTSGNTSGGQSSVSSDAGICQYQVADEASSEKNEALEAVNKANGSISKTYLNQIVDTCISKNGEMTKILSDLDKYAVTVSDIKAVSSGISDSLANEIFNLESYTTKIADQIKKIQAEIQEEEKKYKEEIKKGKKADKNVLDSSKAKIESLKTDQACLRVKISDAEAIYKKAIERKVNTLADSQDDMNAKIQTMSNSAVDANEYADATIEAGKIVSKYDYSAASANGWGQWVNTQSSHSTYSSFNINTMYYVDLQGAQYEGFKAIALGEQLGGSSQNVMKELKAVGSSLGIGFGGFADKIIGKQYVDTSGLADLQEFETGYYMYNGSSTNFYGSYSSLWSNNTYQYNKTFGSTWGSLYAGHDSRLNSKNQEIYNSNLDILKKIADASNNKNA